MVCANTLSWPTKGVTGCNLCFNFSLTVLVIHWMKSSMHSKELFSSD